MLKIAHCIESGVAIQTAIMIVFSAYFKMVQKIGYDIIYLVAVGNGMLFCAAVGVSGGGDSMVDADAGNGVQSDKGTVIFASVIVGAFHQCTLWEDVAYFQVSAYRSMKVTQHRLVLSCISKCFHYLASSGLLFK